MESLDLVDRLEAANAPQPLIKRAWDRVFRRMYATNYSSTPWCTVIVSEPLTVDRIEDMLIAKADPEQAQILKMRGEFAKIFCAQKGWDIDNPTIEQLLEIREQPQWKTPLLYRQGEKI